MKTDLMKRSVLGGVSLALVASAAPAATMLIDFGRNDNQTPGNYNNVTGSGTALDTPSVALIDTTGAATGITLNTDFSAGGSWAGSGADYNGPYPGIVAGQPATALADSMFIRDPASTSLTLTGLDPVVTYEIVIYGARGNNGGPDTEWTVSDGNGTSSAAFDVFNNATEVATFTGLVPDGSNEISFVYTTTDDGSRPRGGMNFMQIVAVPEPSSALLLGASAGIPLLRRRRDRLRPNMR